MNAFTYKSYTDSASNYKGKVSESFSRKIINAENDFEIILIGLDGSIKLKQTELLLTKDLFNIIDAMPIRKSELKN
jgi:hypothetical protein